MKEYLNHNHQKAWVVAVNMGYGHQRAAYPLKELAYKGEIINANNYRGIIKEDRHRWEAGREFYEFMSRFKQVPIIGEEAWYVYNKFQEIPAFYPKRDLSEPSMQLKQTYSLITKKKWGAHLISHLEKKSLPLITTFFIPAFMADVFNYSNDIYCVICDADISRAWAPLNPAKSRIKYFAPNYRVVERLKLYGVKTENIFLTGFPLPFENIGNLDLNILKRDLGLRLYNLDPKERYVSQFGSTIKTKLGAKNCFAKSNHPLTLMFAVGGAGAQRDLGVVIVKSLAGKIKQNKIKVVLVAGIHNDVNQFFKHNIKALGLGSELGRNIKIIFAESKDDYFQKFNRALRTVDILWTKPSELSFYTALGLPIIIAPPIGSQEDFNKKWLTTIGSGVAQEDPRFTDQWLFDWLDSGWLAEAAMQGFIEAGKYGVYNIEKIISKKIEEMQEVKTVLQY